jgi:2-polyprenyl-3-methyl-5-hydroxy-6-metoxy-1,4-benzoquinol methylase
MASSLNQQALAARRGAAACRLCGHSRSTRLCRKNGFDLARCESCELIFVANPPHTEQLSHFYSFDHGYQAHFAGAQSDARAEGAARRHLGDLRRYKRAGRLLDVGCSAGIFLKAARAAGWEVCGVELSEDTASIARQRFGLDVRGGALTESTFAPASFDAVTLWDVVEHLPDPVPVLRIARTILKDDGVLLIETPNVEGLFPRLSYRAASDGRYWRHPEPPAHLFQFSKKTMGRALQASGLRAIEIADRRIPLFYSFGRPAALVRSPKSLAYALAFAPFAALGPLLGQGDSMVAAAVKA